MARVINQSIPPSLRTAVARVLSIPGFTGGPGAAVGLAPSARQSFEVAAEPEILRVMKHAAKWLADDWNPRDYAGFREARRNELASLQFPPAYWYEIAPTADLTDYGEPTVGPYVGAISPAYLDPNRQPSSCEYGAALRTYPTPIFPGTLAQPSPGWQGTVINGIWRDLWFAQRRLMYTLPVTIIRPNRGYFDRPLIATIDGSVNALASYRGVLSWLSLNTYPQLYRAANGVPADANRLVTHWSARNFPRMILPPEVPFNWSATANYRTFRGLAYYGSFGKLLSADRLLLRVITPPSRGLYFGRNDDVSVSHDITVRLYLGKGKNG